MTVHKLKIEEITPDKELRELLRQLGNQDDVIRSREVDSNKDGYLDVNAVTEKWPEYLLQRVEHALFSKRLIDSEHPHLPLLKIRLNNPEQTPLNIRVFDAFDPHVELGEILDLRTMGLGSLDARVAQLNLGASLQADNPDTLTNEGIENIARYLLEGYFPTHSEILTAFGVTDARHLTPRQAVQLAATIPIERIEYSRAQAGVGSSDWREISESTETALNDKTPIEQLFRWDRDEDGNGVCRNYATVARGVLDALKSLQDPATNQLDTTYALELGYNEYGEHDYGLIPGFIDNHAWSGYVTVTANGIEATVLDSTWADRSSLGQDPAQVGSGKVKLDYTKERFLTLVANLRIKGLVDTASFGSELLQSYNNSPQPVFPALNASNVEQEFRSPPPGYLIGSQIIQILVTSPHLIESFEPQLTQFLSSYVQALKDHARQMGEAQTHLHQDAFARFMLSPFLENLKGLVQVCQLLPDGFEGKEEFLGACSHLLQYSFDHFRPIYIYDYLRMAEKLHNRDVADQCIDAIIKDKNLFDKDRLKSIASAVSPERLSIYRDKFSIQLDSDKDRPQKELEDFYGLVDEVVEGLPLEDRSYLRQLGLRVLEKTEEYSFNPKVLSLVPDMSEVTIDQRIQDALRFNREWEAFVSNCPCSIEIPEFLPIQYESQLFPFLEGAKEYFSQVDLSLVRYKKITIDNEDKTEKYLEPKISIQHFIDRDFEAIDLFLKTHKPAQYTGLVNRREIQRKYQELERSRFVKGNIDLSRSDEDLPQADAFYEPLSQALIEFERYDATKRLSSRPLELEIRPRRKDDPSSDYLLTQEGHVTLFLDLSPQQAGEALIEAGKNYCRFIEEIVRLQTQGNEDSFILFEPTYKFEALTPKTFERLLEVERITRPLMDQSNSDLGFDDIKIFFDNDSLTVELNVGGSYGRPDRQYKVRLKAQDSASFMRGVIPFVTKARGIENRAVQFEKDHEMNVFFWFEQSPYDMSFDYLGRALDNAKRFFARPRPEYAGYTLRIYSSSYSLLGEEVAPHVFVSVSDRIIYVKAEKR